MITEFAHRGIWWFPSEPQKRFPGHLKFRSDEGATLEIYGYFEAIKDIKEWKKKEIILGITHNGDNVTLINCTENTKNIGFKGHIPITSTFNIDYLLIGFHFTKLSDIIFNKIYITYNNLDEWINISGFSFKEDDEEIIIKYKIPKTLKAVISEDWEILFGIKMIGPTYCVVQKEAKIEQRNYILLKASINKLFETYIEYINIIQNLLSFAIMDPVFPIRLQASGDFGTASIYYKFSDVFHKPKKVYPDEMLFNFNDIANKFEFIIKNWVKKAYELELIHELYFGTMYNPQMYPNHKFLSLIQAIESYHREVLNNDEISKDEHKKRLRKIKSAIPEYKDWLERKLSNSNEPSLSNRLRELFNKYIDIINKYIPNIDEAIKMIVATRNALVHPSFGRVEKAAKGKELYNITKYTKIILEIAILNEIGFTIIEIDNIFKRNKKYQRILTN